MGSLLIIGIILAIFDFLYQKFIVSPRKEIQSLKKQLYYARASANNPNVAASQFTQISNSTRENEFKQLQSEISRLNKELESARKSNSITMDSINAQFMSQVSQLNRIRSDFDTHVAETRSLLQSNLTAIPYMAKIISDFDTRNLDILAQQLNWGSDQKRLKKVKSILEIKKETASQIAQYKEFEYQLHYAMQMFPALQDFLNTDYNTLDSISISDLQDIHHDSVLGYLSTEEYNRLSSIDRNQLALDRYLESRHKSNWQIGRDYELYVGYCFAQEGYVVEYHGIEKGLEDLGRDLIATKKGVTYVVQCKYWSSVKQIHENHISQLFGTTVCYCYEHGLPMDGVIPVLVTNICISDAARNFSNYLNVRIVENFSLGDFPRIKCNINYNSCGEISRIYHLPFDQQYDSCKIDRPGEFMAMTVAEAEAAGFRRAFRWHGTSNP